MKTPLSVLSTLFCLLLLWTASCKKDPDPTPGGTTTPGSSTGTAGTKSSAKAITAFAFNALNPAVAATIDATAKTISATITSGTDVTKLVPTITVSDKATVLPATNVAQDFSKAVTYTVTAEDGSTQAYTASVVVNTPTGSPAVTITELKAVMPTIADMDISNNRGAVLFAMGSKLYYLGRSKANGGLDFKYFFEYDLATDKWTQKEDFPFKHNTTVNYAESNANAFFVHDGKGYFTNVNYTFFDYDPTTNKWSNSGFGFSSLSNDWTSYNQGKLYGVTGQLSTAFVIDVASKTVKNYPMKVKQRFNAGTTFFANKKLYSVVTSDINGTTQTGKLEVYEVDYENGNYIAKASYDAYANKLVSATINFSCLVGDKMYFFLGQDILIYDASKDSWERINKSTYGGGKLYAVIGKTIYSMSDYNKLISVQTP